MPTTVQYSMVLQFGVTPAADFTPNEPYVAVAVVRRMYGNRGELVGCEMTERRMFNPGGPSETVPYDFEVWAQERIRKMAVEGLQEAGTRRWAEQNL